MSSFKEWWHKTQFDKEYWDKHKYDHITEYEWAKAGFKAGMLRAAEALCKNCEAEGLNVRCDLCTDVAAIRKEVEHDQTR